MRRIVPVLLAMVMLAGLKEYAFATFGSVSKSTVTASVSFSGAGVVSVSIDLRNLDNSTTGLMTWNTSSITPGSTLWQSATAYILLHSTITAATGGIQIYTDNKAGDASPAYTGTGNPAGLVAVEATTVAPLSMCWRVVDVSTTALTIVQTGDTLYASEIGSGYPCFFWMKDAQTTGASAFVNGEDYVTIKESARGMHHAESTWATGVVSPDYIYIGANFASVVTPRTYKTSTLRIEAFTE